jgi:hypothetical protein
MLNIAESVSPRNKFHSIPGTRSPIKIKDVMQIDRVPSILGIPGIDGTRSMSIVSLTVNDDRVLGIG